MEENNKSILEKGATNLLLNLVQKEPISFGLLVSAIIMILSLLPDINISLFQLNRTYPLQIFVGGLFLFFFFLSIKVNMKDKVHEFGGQHHIFRSIPDNFSTLSILCLVVSLLFLILFMFMCGYAIHN